MGMERGANTENTILTRDSPTARVVNESTTSIDSTSPRVVRGTRQVHQRQTRSNTPLPSIMEVIQPQTAATPTVTTNPIEPTPLQAPPPFPVNKTKSKTRKVRGTTIGSARNSTKKASRKQIQTLIDIQRQQDNQANINGEIEQRTYKLPQAKSYITYHIPTPKSSKPSPIPITQDEEDDFTTEDQPVEPTRRSHRLHQQSTRLASISQHAFHSYIGNAILSNATQNLPPDSIFHTNIEEFANGVVHPETKETITKYNKLLKEPALREV
ncbi:hypothetical protein ACHAXR_003283 [Thalassiosira sp. AJA248-18]